MKKFKVYLMIFMIVLMNFVPYTSIKYYAAETISSITATSNLDALAPVINMTTTNPKITCSTANVTVNSNACYWQQKSGSRWVYYSKNVFVEGTYRYHYSFYLPEKYGQMARYVSMSLDGYNISGEPTYEAGTGYYVSGYSKEYVAKTSSLQSHLVTFDSKGGTPIGDKYIEHGKTILSHGTPYKEGYVFDGWYWKYLDEVSNKVVEEKFDFSTPITDDIILYAIWISNEDASLLEDVDSDYNDLMRENTNYTGGYYTILDKVNEQCDVYITIDGNTMPIATYYANGGETIELGDSRLSYDKYVDGEIKIFSYENGKIKGIPNNATITMHFDDDKGNTHGTSTVVKKGENTYYFKIHDDELLKGVKYRLMVDIISTAAVRIPALYYVRFSDANINTYELTKTGTGCDIDIEITENSTLFSFPGAASIRGDADGNGVVDANDASIVLELYKNNINYSYYWNICDLDDNKVIDANDASLILEIYKTNV